MCVCVHVRICLCKLKFQLFLIEGIYPQENGIPVHVVYTYHYKGAKTTEISQTLIFRSVYTKSI